MELIALAIPFFLGAIAVEAGVDRWRGAGFYRVNDAINSLSTGILSTTTGYFTKLLPLAAWGLVLEHAALVDMPLARFGLSPAGLALWVVAALAWDFCYYWFHRFSHEIAILWAAHAVHHQSEEFNLTTALRQTSTGFLFGWIFYLPLFLVGFPLEVLLAVNAVNLIYQFWVHTRFVGRMGRLEAILVTPSNHRVHHAQNERYIDRNYGGILIVWDRLFGTFEAESDEDPVVFGVRKPLASWNPLWANLQVYSELWSDARRAGNLRGSIGTWFRRSAWRPDDVARRNSVPDTSRTAFRKFDPPLGPRVRGYVGWQFAVALAGALGIALAFAVAGPRAVMLPCLVLWVQLYSLGLLNEGRSSGVRAEIVRLVFVVPLGTAFIDQSVPGPLEITTWLLVLGYVLVSLAALRGVRAELANEQRKFIVNSS